MIMLEQMLRALIRFGTPVVVVHHGAKSPKAVCALENGWIAHVVMLWSASNRPITYRPDPIGPDDEPPAVNVLWRAPDAICDLLGAFNRKAPRADDADRYRPIFANDAADVCKIRTVTIS